VQTAQLLAKEYDKAVKLRGSLPWSQPKRCSLDNSPLNRMLIRYKMSRIDHRFDDKVLADLALAGVGVHHAGLTFDDRRATEDLYLKKILRVIVSTSVSLDYL
jgi:ATP-dependent DNA helicase HFM1/MER3